MQFAERNYRAAMAATTQASTINEETIITGLIRRVLFRSGVFIIFAQFIFNISAADHEADAFRTIVPPAVSSLDNYLRVFFSGLQRWDAQHYLHIAQYGYTYEQSLAFFPLFPWTIYVLATILHLLLPSFLISFYTCLIICGVILNLCTFFAAGWCVYALTKSGLASKDFDVDAAISATILFALNPANIFFRAVYTESSYVFLTFLGLHCLYSSAYASTTTRPARNILEASVCFGLAFAVRSNGLLNFGYIIYYYCACWLRPFAIRIYDSKKFIFHQPLQQPHFPHQHHSAVSKRKRGRFCTILRTQFEKLSPSIVVFLLAIVAFFTPFFLVQYYQYKLFCTNAWKRTRIPYEVTELARAKNYVLPGDFRQISWCKISNSTAVDVLSLFDFPYASVQAKYWNVGFLGYYEWKKLPLFILASPTFGYAVCACMHYLTEMRLSENGSRLAKLINQRGVLPFVVHVIVLTVTGMFFINVEVFTRLLFSSTPLVYWYGASFFVEKPEALAASRVEKTNSSARQQQQQKNGPFKIPPGALQNRARLNELDSLGLFGCVGYLWRRGTRSGKIILIWFLLYAVIGTAAHANFLPWT